MRDRHSTVSTASTRDDRAWSELVSREVAATEAAALLPEVPPPAGAVVGTLRGFTEDGVLLVSVPGQADNNPVPCRTTVDVSRNDVGREGLLVLEGGDPRRPILIGCLKETAAVLAPAIDIKADGESVTVTAKQQIVLRCGKASLTLTNAGKVILQGEYISQRSMGVVRIKGGCVEIN